MSTEMTEEIKATRVLPFSGQQVDWDKWSKKYQGIATERGYLKIMLGMQRVPNDAIDIDQKVDSKYLIPDDERKQMHQARKMNEKGIETCSSLLPSWLFNLFLWQRQWTFPVDLWQEHGLHSRMSMIHQKEKTR